MQRAATSRFRTKINLPLMAFALASAGFLIGMVLAMHYWGGIPIGNLTRDPAALSGTPSYIGFLSQAGLFLWSAAAAICIFTARTVRKDGENEERTRFLFASGFLTMLLGLDDAFLLHEEILPGIGIPEKAVLVTYVALTLLYLVRFHRPILQTGYELLGLAFFFFGSSVVLDLLNPPGVPFFLEDAAKIAGIVSWLSYFSCAAAGALDGSVVGTGTSSEKDSAALPGASSRLSPSPVQGAADLPMIPLRPKFAARRACKAKTAAPATM